MCCGVLLHGTNESIYDEFKMIELINEILFTIFIGVFMGWLRFSDQLDSSTCIDFNHHWKILSSHLCCIQYGVLHRDDFVNANTLRWISARSDL